MQTQNQFIEGFRLSPQQQSLWSLQRDGDGQQPYRVQASVLIEGQLDIEALERAIGGVVRRHEILRTNFRLLPGMNFPLQVINPDAHPRLALVEVSGLPPGEQEQTVKELIQEACRSPFDFEQGALLQFSLVKLSHSRHLLIVGLHALCCDLAGLDALIREIGQAYGARPNGDGETEETMQYADLAEIFNEALESEETTAGREHWLNQNAAATTPLQLPFANPVHANAGFNPQTIYSVPDDGARLRRVIAQTGLPASVFFQACWQLLLWRLTGQADVTVYVSFDGRTYDGLDKLPGLFARHLPLACSFAAGLNFTDALSHASEAACAARQWQEYFAVGPTDSQTECADTRRPIGFEFHERLAAFEAGGLKWTLENQHGCTARFEFNLRVIDCAGEGFRFEFQFDEGQFARESCERIVSYFNTLLASIALKPRACVEDFEIVDESERRRELYDYNDTAFDFGHGLSLHSLFERCAASLPDAPAVISEGRSLSYAELDRRSSLIASRLRSSGITTESLVALLLERTEDLPAAILGTLKAGAAYLPLDPEDPSARLAFLLSDSNCAALITAEGLRASVPADCAVPLLCLEEGWHEAATDTLHAIDESDLVTHDATATDDAPAHDHARADNLRDNHVRADNAAYVIYTSGSTGRPKGVVITHRCALNFLRWSQFAFPLSTSDRVLHKTASGFDASVWELFAPLTSGACLVLARPGAQRDPDYLARLIAGESITHLKLVPSLLRALVAGPGLDHCGALRAVFCGGEALDESLADEAARQLPKGARLWNMYGPTETTVDVALWRYEGRRKAATTVSIGRAIANTQLYLLDEGMRPVAQGVVGELYVGGEQLGRGYLNRADLTAERFVPDLFSKEMGGRLYRTGDLVRRLEGGELEFVGRKDSQIKLRGHRIELGEVEVAVCEHDGVREAAAAVRGEEAEAQLLLCVVWEGAEDVKGEGASAESGGATGGRRVGELRAWLTERLAGYMVPQVYVELSMLPRLGSGKLDRRALAEVAARAIEVMGSEAGYEAPRDAEEEALAEVWREVLGVKRVGIHDNFFHLGGDSIRSVRILALARERGLNFSLQQLFKYQTIAELSQQLAGSESPELVVKTEPFGLISDEDRRNLPAGVEDAYPLAMLQAGMLYHMEMWPESPAYHNINTWHLRAPYDEALLRDALQHVVNRHPVLRTSFDLTTYGEPLQLVHRSVELSVIFEDLRHLSEVEREAVVEGFLQREKRDTLDVTKAPLIRYHVHRYTEDTFQFTLTECHPISDGYSTTTTLAESFQRYLALVKGEVPAADEPLTTTFRDFVHLERLALESGESRKFWNEKLSGCTPIRIPHRSPSARTVEGARIGKKVLSIPPDLVRELNKLAQSCSVPLKSVLLSAHLRVLNLISGQNDVLTGLLFNGRPEERDGEQIRGLFLNTLPFRLELPGGSWCELVKDAFRAEREILPHRRYPLAELQQERGREALFETMFTYLNFHSLKDILRSGEIQPIERGTRDLSENHFALYVVFYVMPDGSHIKLILDFDVTRFSEEQVETIQGFYETTLRALVSDPSARYESQNFLSEDDRKRLLVEWNDTAVEYEPRCVSRLFETQAARTPRQVAVEFDGKRLTYAELETRANRLAHYLRRCGVGDGSLVGVLLDRSTDLLVALLGVFKAGAAYVPLDPSYPRERLRMMAEDAGLRAVLTQASLAATAAELGASEVICLETRRAEIEQEAADHIEGERDAESPAYVIYTSGSTGRPKGVVVPHRALHNFLSAMRQRPGLRADDVLLSVTTLSFDIAGLELFLPLVEGGRVVLASRAEASDGRRLMKLLSDSGATFMQATPATWRLLLDAGWRGDAQLKALCGGETLKRDLATEMLGRCGELWNMYGPTETTIWSVAQRVEAGDGPVPIGRPITNTQLYILSAQLQPVPIGVAAELYIGGEGVARDYLNRPELTAERFIPDPFGARAGARLYRTGDLARYLPGGEVEFLGRIDSQVKVRGHRIELGEIEAALSEQPEVRQAVVAARADAGGDTQLVAYVVARQPQITVGELRSALRMRLPEYMIPSAFVMLDALPLTPNGKLDRQLLPAPDGAQLETETAYVAPRHFIEEEIATIWREVLRIPRAGIHDNFFEVGGHSLRAIQMLSHVRASFAVDVALGDFFVTPTIERLARLVEESIFSSVGDAAIDEALNLLEEADRDAQQILKPGLQPS